ncbi:MAG: prepilin-type N-terminal cleavage/methylation domain-containing protein [Lachnospirales bacterium]
MKKSKKGFALVEVLAALAILALLSVGVFVYISRQNDISDILVESMNVYREMTYELSQAENNDNDITDSLQNGQADELQHAAEIKSVQIKTIHGDPVKDANGDDVEVSFELFTATEQLSDGNIINAFAYNFEDLDN